LGFVAFVVLGFVAFVVLGFVVLALVVINAISFDPHLNQE